MSELTPDEWRERLEERKRINLTEGRELLDRLDAALTRIHTLQEQLTESDTDTAASSAGHDAGDQPHAVPDTLKTLLAEARQLAHSSEPASIPDLVYDWCTQWLQVRTNIQKLLDFEQQVEYQIEQLEVDAEQIMRRLNETLTTQ